MSDHPHDQLGLHTPGSDSASSTVHIRRRDKFCKLWGISKSQPKEITESLDFRPLSQQSTQPPSAVSLVSNHPSDDNQSFASSGVQDKPLPLPPSEAQHLADIFADNLPKPIVKADLPCLQERIERTEQLVYCNTLLLQDLLSPHETVTGKGEAKEVVAMLQGRTFDKAELDWLETTKKDPMEADRLRWIATRVVEQFVTDANKDSIKIAEIVALGPVLEKEHYRKLLLTFIKEFDDSHILNVDIMQGLVHLVQDASPDRLVSNDLVKVLGILRVHLEGTHKQSTEHSYYLTLAVSRVLDVMADHKVQDVDRVLEHEPLSAVLAGLKGSSDPYLLYQACYAFQALQYVPDDETALGAVFRHTTGVADGLTKVSAVVTLDLTTALEGLGKLQEALGKTVEVAGSVYEGFCLLMKSGRGVFDSLKEAFGSGRRHPWYPAVRTAYAFAQASQLKDLKQLVFDAPCRQDHFFQWGISQLLGEIAVDPVLSILVRQQAVSLLGHLYQHDQDWGQHESVKAWMLTIITEVCVSSDQAVNEAACSVLQGLTVDQNALIKHPYPLRARLPLPSTSPLLTKVQNIQHLEYDLHKFRLQRLEEAKLPVYISPMAMANLQAHDNDIFPLKEKVLEFLSSERQVMLILGDSGAGKSTFIKHLESELLHTYTCGGPIPLFINLPAIREPDCDMIEKQLKSYNFNDEQIRELKLHRQLILICDGYDESQLTVNLHTVNLFNKPGQWNVKMVISCRTQFLGQGYRSRFMPEGSSHYQGQAIELFQEAVMAPFTKEQIEDYVEQYVPLEPRTWTTKDYMDKLTTIPNLMDLVKNPFLLSLSLEALPGVTEGQQDLSVIKITRVQLYDTFVRHWLTVNSRRLQRNVLTREDRVILGQLFEAGFISMGVDYATRLASAMFEHQDGNPMVQYVHIKDEKSWRAEFFGPDPKTRFMLESSLITRAGSQFRFLHRSMLEYFLSCAVFDPSRQDVDDESSPQPVSDYTPAQPLASDGPLFKRDLLTEPSVIQFLCERAKQHPCFENQLLAVIEQSKTDATAATAAANAITILVRAGVRFNSADLRGIRIPGADVSDGQFDYAQFQGADLRGVNFARSWLRQVNFGDAQMGGVRFGELPYLQEKGSVITVAFSPNGMLFAVILDDGSLTTYDTTTWIRVRQHKEPSELLSIAFSPNNRHLAFGNRDMTCRLWDTVNGETLLVMEGHTGVVRSVAFSPCGKQIASTSNDGTIRLWSSETGECLFVLSNSENIVLSFAYSADGRRLVSNVSDGTIRVWDPKTGAPEAGWVIPRIDGSCLTLSADGRQFALITGWRRGNIQLVDAISGETGLILNDDADWLTEIAFSPVGELIVSSSTHYIVRLWDSSSGQLISTFSGHDREVIACTFSPDGLQIASGDRDGIIRLWEVNTNRSNSITQKRAVSVRTVAYSHNGLLIISGHGNYTIQRWDSSTGVSESIPLPSISDVDPLLLSPNGHWFAGGCENGNIQLCNARTDIVERVLSGSNDCPVVDISFSLCGRWLASCHTDGAVLLWDLYSTDNQGKVMSGTANLKRLKVGVVFSPVGDQLAVVLVSMPSKIRVFDLRVTDSLQPLKEVCIPDTLCSMEYSPDGQRLVLGTGTSFVLLWDLQLENPDIQLVGHTGAVICVAYSPSGKWILSGSHDMTVRLWSGEIENWPCVAVVSGFLMAVTSIAWSPVAPMEFVTGSHDGSVQVWRIVGAEAGEFSIRMHWGSQIGQLCVKDLTLKGVVSLIPIYRKLLAQRGAIDGSLLPEGDEAREE